MGKLLNESKCAFMNLMTVIVSSIPRSGNRNLDSVEPEG